MNKNFYTKYGAFFILGINVILLLVRLLDVLHNPMPLNSDEAQYWLWSKHVDWSYYSKPPLIAWTNHLSTMLLGDTVIGIRINAIAIGFILPFIHYALARRLFKDEKVAFWSSIVLFVLPHYHFVSKVFTTDTLLVLFWSLNMLFCLHALQKDKLKYWVLSGLTLGLGIISKYTMLLWVPSLVFIGWLGDRNLLKMPRFYVSMFIAFIICTPVLFWNLSRDFVGARHIFGLMGAYKPHGSWLRSIGRIFEYFGGQLLSISPIFLPVYYKLYKKWRNKELTSDYKAVIFLLVPLLLVWGLFLVLSIKKNYINWTFFAFTSLPLLVGYSLAHFFNNKQRLRYVGITGILMLMVSFPSALDTLGMKNLYPPTVDIYSRQAAWDQLGEKVTEVLDKLGPDNIFIFSDSYHIASVLSFYVDGNPQTYCVNDGRRMNQFDLWPGIDQFEHKGYDALYVSSQPLPESVRKSSQTIQMVTKQERTYRGQKVQPDVNIYYLKGFDGVVEKRPTQF